MLSANNQVSTKALEYKTTLLSSGFTGDLITPSDPEYEAALVRFAKNAKKPAAVVAYVKSHSDISTVLHFATSNNIEVVVRGGGHNCSGSSSTDGGIVIDMSRHFKTVKVDVEKRLGYVGGGCTWSDVDLEAIKHGLASVAGTVNHTGVGGLSLGGGYGWLTGEHGLVIDNVVQATLVTAGGETLTVNSESHPDLYWGIRGGGCNFGVVTEFVYILHPQRPTIFAGPLVFPPPRISEVVATLEEWRKEQKPDEGAILVNISHGHTGGPEVAVMIFFNGEEDEGKKRFKKLYDLGPVASMAGMIPYENLNTLQNPMIHFGAHHRITCLTRASLPPNSASQIFDALLASANASHPSIEEASMLILWEYHNLQKQSSVAPDATAYRMRHPFANATLIITWSGDSVEAGLEAKKRLGEVKTVATGLLDLTFEGGKRHEEATGYGNYEVGGPMTPGVAEKYFARNYPRLQALKKKYDPNVVFGTWYAIQPSD